MRNKEYGQKTVYFKRLQGPVRYKCKPHTQRWYYGRHATSLISSLISSLFSHLLVSSRLFSSLHVSSLFDVLPPRVLLAPLLRHVHLRPLEYLQQRLLDPLPRHIPSEAPPRRPPRDFVDLVDVDDPAARPLDVVPEEVIKRNSSSV